MSAGESDPTRREVIIAGARRSARKSYEPADHRPPELEGPVGSETRNGMGIDWDVPLPMDDGLIRRADLYRPIAEGRGRRDRRTDRSPSGRVPSLPVAGTDARLSAQQGDSVDRLRTAHARPGGERPDTCCHRPQAWRDGPQVAIAWLLDQEGVIAIPKAGRPESQKANLEALTISLDDEDRAAIAALPKDQRFVRPPFAPEWDAVV
jgi:hypothetical protein